ncbi:MAG: TolC family protein, partial [Planctomycetota bacterium]
MFCKFRPITSLYCVLGIAVIFCIAGGCSREHYKAEADKEVYNIIDGKWRDNFGSKVNYTINDLPASPNDVQIENAVPPSGVITLAQAVAMATAHNRGYQTQKEQLYLTALDLTLVRHQFAKQWFGTFDTQYVRDSEDEEVSYDAGVGFSRLLADGAVVSAGLALDWARFLTGDPQTSLGSVLSASIRQPLLRGRGRKVVQENLTQAERDVLYQIRSFNRFRKTFVVSIITDYYRVLQLRDVATNAENNWKRKEQLRKRLEMEADEGQTARFLVDQAEQSELSARDSWVRAMQSYEQQLDVFKIRLSLPTSTNVKLDENELKALVEKGIVEADYTLGAAIETALLRRLDLANSRDGVDDTARKVIVAADGLGTQLDLIGSAGVGSTEKTDFTRLEFHNGTYSLGLKADLPLDRKAERNAYREALVLLEQRQRQFDNDRDNVELDVREAHRRLQQEAKSYGTQNVALKLAQKRVDVSPLLWEAGRSNARDLIESQDALLEAQNRLTAALVAHLIAKLNFFQDVGIL